MISTPVQQIYRGKRFAPELGILGFHMTSGPPCWWPWQTMKRPTRWRPDQSSGNWTLLLWKLLDLPRCKNLWHFFFVLLARSGVWLLFNGLLALLFSFFEVIREFDKFLYRGWAKLFLLLSLKNMAVDHVGENQEYNIATPTVPHRVLVVIHGYTTIMKLKVKVGSVKM